MNTHVVAIYHVSQEYGGPEEGGWYYKAGRKAREPELSELTQVFDTTREAYRYAHDVNASVCFKWNDGQRPIWSVLPGDIIAAFVFRGDDAPTEFPEERPRWE
jgi:hypothetical protein